MEQSELKEALAYLEQHARAVHLYLAGLDRNQPVPHPPALRGGGVGRGFPTGPGVYFLAACGMTILGCHPAARGSDRDPGARPVTVGDLIDSVDLLAEKIKQVGGKVNLE